MDGSQPDHTGKPAPDTKPAVADKAAPVLAAPARRRKPSTHRAADTTAAPPLAGRSWPGILLFILSLAYLIAEVDFNMSLLDVAGSVRSDPAETEDLQVFGRTVSACGCFLLVLGFFSGTGFHIAGQRLRRIFLTVATLSLLPFVLIVLQAFFEIGDSDFVLPINPSSNDVMLSMFPLLGIAYGLLMGMNRNAFVTMVSLFMIVWPSVFLGQKLLIEQALIERTSWEQRVNARYVLMLRAGLEDCAIDLKDLELCDAEKEQDNVKSARIILGSMWMLSPEGIRRDMEENRERLVKSVASRGLWFSVKDEYAKYVKMVTDKRNQIETEFLGTVFTPYKAASDTYIAAVDPKRLSEDSRKASDKVEQQIDQGWRQYQNAVREYRQRMSASGLDVVQRLAPYKQRLRDFCAGRNCPPIGGNRSIVADAGSYGEQEFSRQSGGYAPDIATREEFIAAYPTQIKIRESVEKYIHEQLKNPNFMLPANWRYSRESFEQAAEILMRQEIDRRWKEKMGDKLVPGLPVDKFLSVMELQPVPPVEALLKTPDAFFTDMIMPQYRKILDKMLGDIDGEKMLYANGEALAEKGKDYARAVYIPAVSLIISLIVVILTLLRWWNIMVRHMLASAMRHRQLTPSLRPVAQMMLLGVFVGGILIIPRFVPNPYAGDGYERYRNEAARESPMLTSVLDWAIHTQPTIYRMGYPVREILGRVHGTAETIKKNATIPPP